MTSDEFEQTMTKIMGTIDRGLARRGLIPLTQVDEWPDHCGNVDEILDRRRRSLTASPPPAVPLAKVLQFRPR